MGPAFFSFADINLQSKEMLRFENMLIHKGILYFVFFPELIWLSSFLTSGKLWMKEAVEICEAGNVVHNTSTSKLACLSSAIAMVIGRLLLCYNRQKTTLWCPYWRGKQANKYYTILTTVLGVLQWLPGIQTGHTMAFWLKIKVCHRRWPDRMSGAVTSQNKLRGIIKSLM